MPADYGASLAGVARLLPTVVIDESSTPSKDTVEEWLTEFAGDVERRLGDITVGLVDPELATAKLAVRRLIHYATAAATYDALHPERAGDERSYGVLLWNRYNSGLDALDADDDTAGDGSGDGAATLGQPAGSFPAPLFPDELVL